ncbi:cryptochrome/photolyase family protein [Panacibacter sp. DH6]|uniref:Cryptochrome/photolyase family protein n=1 Tax=Panacibacter microcysteis TaxID=2793269 RepID=A0A931E8K7_9BACT|nr:cryptochrome/photolyase family protein [Panacibacter microcysteis]MBG9375721.1 cryptochrome/photolyase family protein [Panacibacter microcysteis]
MDVTIIFPHQLFKQHPAIATDRAVYLVEEWLFFKQFNFHKQKLVLHRASMKQYEALLQQTGKTVTYVNATEDICDTRKLVKHLHTKKTTAIHVAELTDDWLKRRLVTACKKYKIRCIIYRTPGFLNTLEEADDYFKEKSTYFQTDFYIAERKKRKLLLDEHDKPLGGKWTYDAENRLKFPKGETVPKLALPEAGEYTKEARRYIEQHFADNYGNALSPFPSKKDTAYPVTHEDAEKWLRDFLQNRFEKFGIYEDAMVAAEHVLYHSVLTPALNIGLLTPAQVVTETINIAKHNKVPLNSVEGFIRQVTGWREFIRIVYEREGRKQRTKNYWQFNRKIPKTFWTGNTGIVPVDIVIQKVLQSGYSHHIERLMIIGNFMLLCEFNPDEVYKWFMEMYVDAYDWVMVPNVYGMTQFADGGLMTTKPYISGSNYLLKMGNWQKGDWQKIWDALFWRFMHVHRDFFARNARLGMLLKTFDKMPAAKRNSYIDTAEDFLHQLDTTA